MGPHASPRRAVLLAGIAAGLLALAVGVALAQTFLPEWREDRVPPQTFFRQRYGELAARGGFLLLPGEPRVRLATHSIEEHEPFRMLGEEGSEWLLATRTGVRAEVLHRARRRDMPGESLLSVAFSLEGVPQSLMWWRVGSVSVFNPGDLESGIRLAERLAPVMLSPAERLGAARADVFGNSPRLIIPILGSERPEHLMAMSGGVISIVRRAGQADEKNLEAIQAQMTRTIRTAGWRALAAIPVLGLFAVLLLKSRIGALNGALLALLSLVTLNPLPWDQFGSPVLTGLAMVVPALWIFILWSCAESLLRSADAGFTTSLDALRAGRLGPRGSRGLLTGFAFGAGLAGLALSTYALAEALPGSWPETASLHLPTFRPTGSPVADGVVLAAGIALSLALALRVLPVRWASLAGALAAAAWLVPLQIQPFPAKLAANTALAGLLVYVCRRHGLTALLTAAVVSGLLPVAVFAGLHPDWMRLDLAVAAGLPAVIVLLGFLGLSRSAAAEVQRLTPPAFVRRLEDQRRLRSEMALLARMQRGLLPRTLPKLGGWEVAAHSALANEAGGDLYDFLTDDNGHLWVAAGDVAGHGFSCAVAQAMTKSALASLIRPGRTPAEVLQRTDAVLRAAGPARNFTSLTLLRLQPATGEAILANAGHPYPLLCSGGEVSEIALPGLPLGLGPPRHYQDHALHLPPGAVLVFCSDGFFEAMDPKGEPYGYEHAHSVLRAAAEREAAKILGALLADWRRHLRGAAAIDDTTVVVLRRTGGRSEQ